MKSRKQHNFFLFFLILQIVLLQTTGCQKELYFDQINGDPLAGPVKAFPACSSCRATDSVSLATWNFKTGNSFLCGIVDAAGIDFGKTAFTFFGPSACSIDTGLVMTIYLPVTLDEDRFNITTTKTAFFYYAHHATNDIFISQPATLFTVNLESYIHATGIATGTFSGTVFKPNGDAATVSEGNFKIQFK